MKKAIAGIFFLLVYISSYSQNKVDPFFKGELIVKIKAEYGQKCNESAIAIPEIYEVVKNNKIYQTEKLFPRHQGVKEKNIKKGWVDLSTIYTFRFDESVNPRKIITQLEKEDAVEYVELNYENFLTYSPSDTAKSQQWYLDAIDVFKAWDVEKGDTNVVIAIVDTGSDLDHEDMIDDFAYNYDDPINGIDDDNDGFIDNFNGWDVANNDNDPSLNLSGHGMNCAGIASASTDNVTGISGVGFNTRILTVRIDEENSARLTGAYPGIVYAADHGADIISNSWGGNTYSKFSQDVVNYAAINKGALVIGAIGNFGEEKFFYPAAYDNILSVGATIPDDTVKANSNYGYWVDIMAPGEWMHTTGALNSYHGNGGTSMAGPVVAGVAALVKSHFPSYTAKQIHHQLLNAGDNIDAANDAKYLNKVGAGRINAYKAVTETSLAGIEFENITLDDGDNQFFSSGDEITIKGDFINYLAEANNVSVTLSVIDNEATVLQGSMSFSKIASMASDYIDANPFKIKINNGLAINTNLTIELDITADNFSRKQYIFIQINPDYITVRENELTVTLTSNGAIGYSGNNLSGDGVALLDGNSLLYEGGFIIGNSPSYLLNHFRGQSSNDEDFTVEQSILVDSPTKADFETSAIFNDGNYTPNDQLKILQKNYFFTNADNNRSTIYVFAIENTSSSAINDLYAGLIMDWDIQDFSRNKASYDASRKMGYAFSPDTSLYAGVKALTETIGNTHYAIDNTPDSGGAINTSDGFNDAEKWLSISTNRNQAGLRFGGGSDIIDVNAIGPFSLKPNETKTVSFAVLAGSSLSELQTQSDASQKVFDEMGLTNLSIPRFVPKSKSVLLFPNPANEQINIQLSLDEFARLDLEIYDLNGRLVLQQQNLAYPSGLHQIQLNAHALKTGIYFLELKNERIHFKNKFVIAPSR